MELLAILFVVFVIYLVAEDRGSSRKARAQYETDVTAAENKVASAKTDLRNLKNSPPTLPGWVTVLLVIALVVAFFAFADVLRPHRGGSYWRDR